MSLRDRWVITLSSVDTSGITVFSLKKKTWIILICLFSLFVLTVVIGTVQVWRERAELVQLDKLQRENILLRERLAHFDITLDSLLIIIRIMEDWEDQLRQERRLRPIHHSIRALGTGGEPIVDPVFLPFDLEIHQIYNANLSKLNHLNAKVSLTYETRFDLLTTLQSREFIYRHTPTIWPTFGRITDDFGYRTHPIFRTRNMHPALDIANAKGTPIYSTANGIVTYAGRSGTSGVLLRINHGNLYQTRYAHLDQILVRVGDEVQTGQIVALMGSTGASTGYHLHYEIFDMQRRRHVNPHHFFNLTEDQIVVPQSRSGLFAAN